MEERVAAPTVQLLGENCYVTQVTGRKNQSQQQSNQQQQQQQFLQQHPTHRFSRSPRIPSIVETSSSPLPHQRPGQQQQLQKLRKSRKDLENNNNGADSKRGKTPKPPTPSIISPQPPSTPLLSSGSISTIPNASATATTPAIMMSSARTTATTAATATAAANEFLNDTFGDGERSWRDKLRRREEEIHSAIQQADARLARLHETATPLPMSSVSTPSFERDELVHRLQAKEEEVVSLRLRLSQFDSIQKEMETWRSSMEDSQRALNSALDSLFEKTQQVEELSANIKLLQQRLLRSEREVEDQKRQMETVKRDFTASGGEEVQDLKEVIRSMQKQLTHANARYGQLEAESSFAIEQLRRRLHDSGGDHHHDGSSYNSNNGDDSFGKEGEGEVPNGDGRKHREKQYQHHKEQTLVELLDRNKRLHEELAQSTEEIERSGHLIVALKAQNNQMQETIVSLEEQLRVAKVGGNPSSSSSSPSKYAPSNNSAITSEAVILIDQLREENQRLREEMDEVEDSASREFRARYDELQAVLDTVKRERDEAKASVQTLNHQLHSLHTLNERLTIEMENAEESSTKMHREQMTAMTARLEQVEKERSELAAKMLYLEQESNSQRQMAGAENNNNTSSISASKESEDIIKERNQLKAALQQLEEKFEELQEDNGVLRQEINDFQNKNVRSKNFKADTLETLFSQFEKTQRDHETALSELEKAVDRQQHAEEAASSSSTSATLEQMKAERDEARSAISLLEEECRRQHAENKRLLQEMEEAQSEATLQFRSQYDLLQATLDGITAERDEAVELVNSLRSEAKVSQEDYDALKLKLDDAGVQVSHLASQYQQQQRALEEQIESLKSSLSLITAERDAAKLALDAMSQDAKTLHAQHQTIIAETKELWHKKEEELMAQIQTLHTQCEHLISERDSLQEELDTESDRLKEWIANSHSNDQVKELHVRLDSLQVLLDSTQKERDDVMDSLDAINEESKRLRGENDRLAQLCSVMESKQEASAQELIAKFEKEKNETLQSLQESHKEALLQVFELEKEIFEVREELANEKDKNDRLVSENEENERNFQDRIAALVEELSLLLADREKAAAEVMQASVRLTHERNKRVEWFSTLQATSMREIEAWQKVEEADTALRREKRRRVAAERACRLSKAELDSVLLNTAGGVGGRRGEGGGAAAGAVTADDSLPVSPPLSPAIQSIPDISASAGAVASSADFLQEENALLRKAAAVSSAIAARAVALVQERESEIMAEREWRRAAAFVAANSPHLSASFDAKSESNLIFSSTSSPRKVNNANQVEEAAWERVRALQVQLRKVQARADRLEAALSRYAADDEVRVRVLHQVEQRLTAVTGEHEISKEDYAWNRVAVLEAELEAVQQQLHGAASTTPKEKSSSSPSEESGASVSIIVPSPKKEGQHQQRTDSIVQLQEEEGGGSSSPSFSQRSQQQQQHQHRHIDSSFPIPFFSSSTPRSGSFVGGVGDMMSLLHRLREAELQATECREAVEAVDNLRILESSRRNRAEASEHFAWQRVEVLEEELKSLNADRDRLEAEAQRSKATLEAERKARVLRISTICKNDQQQVWDRVKESEATIQTLNLQLAKAEEESRLRQNAPNDANSFDLPFETSSLREKGALIAAIQSTQQQFVDMKAELVETRAQLARANSLLEVARMRRVAESNNPLLPLSPTAMVTSPSAASEDAAAAAAVTLSPVSSPSSGKTNSNNPTWQRLQSALAEIRSAQTHAWQAQEKSNQAEIALRVERLRREEETAARVRLEEVLRKRIEVAETSAALAQDAAASKLELHVRNLEMKLSETSAKADELAVAVAMRRRNEDMDIIAALRVLSGPMEKSSVAAENAATQLMQLYRDSVKRTMVIGNEVFSLKTALEELEHSVSSSRGQAEAHIDRIDFLEAEVAELNERLSEKDAALDEERKARLGGAATNASIAMSEERAWQRLRDAEMKLGQLEREKQVYEEQIQEWQHRFEGLEKETADISEFSNNNSKILTAVASSNDADDNNEKQTKLLMEERMNQLETQLAQAQRREVELQSRIDELVALSERQQQAEKKEEEEGDREDDEVQYTDIPLPSSLDLLQVNQSLREEARTSQHLLRDADDRIISLTEESSKMRAELLQLKTEYRTSDAGQLQEKLNEMCEQLITAEEKIAALQHEVERSHRALKASQDRGGLVWDTPPTTSDSSTTEALIRLQEENEALNKQVKMLLENRDRLLKAYDSLRTTRAGTLSVQSAPSEKDHSFITDLSVIEAAPTSTNNSPPDSPRVIVVASIEVETQTDEFLPRDDTAAIIEKAELENLHEQLRLGLERKDELEMLSSSLQSALATQNEEMEAMRKDLESQTMMVTSLRAELTAMSQRKPVEPGTELARIAELEDLLRQEKRSASKRELDLLHQLENEQHRKLQAARRLKQAQEESDLMLASATPIQPSPPFRPMSLRSLDTSMDAEKLDDGSATAPAVMAAGGSDTARWLHFSSPDDAVNGSGGGGGVSAGDSGGVSPTSSSPAVTQRQVLELREQLAMKNAEIVRLHSHIRSISSSAISSPPPPQQPQQQQLAPAPEVKSSSVLTAEDLENIKKTHAMQIEDLRHQVEIAEEDAFQLRLRIDRVAAVTDEELASLMRLLSSSGDVAARELVHDTSSHAVQRHVQRAMHRIRSACQQVATAVDPQDEAEQERNRMRSSKDAESHAYFVLLSTIDKLRQCSRTSPAQVLPVVQKLEDAVTAVVAAATRGFPGENLSAILARSRLERESSVAAAVAAAEQEERETITAAVEMAQRVKDNALVEIRAAAARKKQSALLTLAETLERDVISSLRQAIGLSTAGIATVEPVVSSSPSSAAIRITQPLLPITTIRAEEVVVSMSEHDDEAHDIRMMFGAGVTGADMMNLSSSSNSSSPSSSAMKSEVIMGLVTGGIDEDDDEVVVGGGVSGGGGDGNQDLLLLASQGGAAAVNRSSSSLLASVKEEDEDSMDTDEIHTTEAVSSSSSEGIVRSSSGENRWTGGATVAPVIGGESVDDAASAPSGVILISPRQQAAAVSTAAASAAASVLSPSSSSSSSSSKPRPSQGRVDVMDFSDMVETHSVFSPWMDEEEDVDSASPASSSSGSRKGRPSSRRGGHASRELVHSYLDVNDSTSPVRNGNPENVSPAPPVVSPKQSLPVGAGVVGSPASGLATVFEAVDPRLERAEAWESTS